MLQSSGEGKHLFSWTPEKELLSFAELLVEAMVVQLVMKFALYMGPEI